jgi:hypothetical protein
MLFTVEYVLYAWHLQMSHLSVQTKLRQFLQTCISMFKNKNFFFKFFKLVLGGGVQLGPLDTAATNMPIVPAPRDFDDGEIGGMVIGRGNRSTRRKPAAVPLCPP